MMMTRWKVWAIGGVIGAMVAVAVTAGAATFTSSNPGLLAMNPGDNVNVTCGGTNLQWTNTGATSAGVFCVPGATTTTTSTIPATTTTIPATTTTTAPATTTTTAPSTTTTTAPAQTMGCALASPAFCETFNAPAGTGNRSGDLNGLLWGVSRVSGQGFNSGQGQYDNWVAPTQLTGTCPTQNVSADSDIKICNGQLNESVDDNPSLNASNQTQENGNGTVTSLAMYPKQPFDFAGRTGKITFDVGDDSGGMHAAWPEFWVTSTPVPDPFTHLGSWQSLPANGFGIRLGAACGAIGLGSPNGSGGGNCAPNCPSNNTVPEVTVDSIVTVDNYVEHDPHNPADTSIPATTLDNCVKEPTSPGQLNHFEVDVSQTQIDVYGTDAGTTGPLKHLATMVNAGLQFSRGVVWIQDDHYNGNKGLADVRDPNTGQPVLQGMHTFIWDNVGFDGPVLLRDLTFDAPDALTGAAPTENLGYYNFNFNSGVGGTVTLSVPGVNRIANAVGGLLTFNFFETNGTAPTFTYSLNGHATHLFTYPGVGLGGTSRTVGIPITLSELVAGTNTVTVTSNDPGGFFLDNLDLILQGAG